MDDIFWKSKNDEITLSPRNGGKIVSWKHGKQGELVKPQGVVDGGLLRVLFGEERYPGASFTAPHLADVLYSDDRGFSIRLRHYWITQNAIATALGWLDKRNPTYLDGLFLEKTITFDAKRSLIMLEIAITNLTGGKRYLTPWLHNHFDGWVYDDFVVIDGKAQPYRVKQEDIYWAGHRPEPNGQMRLVHISEDASLSIMLGSDTGWISGMASYTRHHYGEKSREGCMELRGKTLCLDTKQRWRANAFLVLADGPDAGNGREPEPSMDLFCRLEPANGAQWDTATLLPFLSSWALPEEREKGLMVLSHLDKVPFSVSNRYSANNSFSCFHYDASRKKAIASVSLFALRAFASINAELTAGTGWEINAHSFGLKQNELFLLYIYGPSDLAGRENVSVRLMENGREICRVVVEPDATIEPEYKYQVKQTSSYLDERWSSEKSGFHGTTAEELKKWQATTRGSLLRWVNNAVIGPATLSPRLMERQVGAYCIREKILIQTEPGMWLPMYLIRPRETVPGAKLPAILFPHGSGPGKLDFAPDETAQMQDSARFDQWPLPYQFSRQLGAVVLIPDRRGWGEWAEANHGQRSLRAFRAGYNIIAMDVWDHIRAVDYLVQRSDVDSSKITSMGSSGGGWLTLLMMGADERVSGGIVSSSLTTMPCLPEHYFFRTFIDENVSLEPAQQFPLAPATIQCLAAPRVLWVMDGKWDKGILPSLPVSKEEEDRIYAKWHESANAGREEIGRIYRLSGAEDNYRSSWFEGGHLAGFTMNNISVWLKEYFGIVCNH